jgi:hypothetical protein
MRRIEGEVPFGDSLWWWLVQLAPDDSSRRVEEARRFDRPYLAWESVRLVRNPYFVKGTGFEGYWVGQSRSAEEVLDELLQIGQFTLDSHLRLYRYQPRFRHRLTQALYEEEVDRKSLQEWSNTLGALLARLRCNVYRSTPADLFRRETYRQVEGLPPIRYRKLSGDFHQIYEIRDADSPTAARLQVDPQQLPPHHRDAWAVAEAIGKFGHPLVRSVLHPPRP